MEELVKLIPWGRTRWY